MTSRNNLAAVTKRLAAFVLLAGVNGTVWPAVAAVTIQCALLENNATGQPAGTKNLLPTVVSPVFFSEPLLDDRSRHPSVKAVGVEGSTKTAVSIRFASYDTVRGAPSSIGELDRDNPLKLVFEKSKSPSTFGSAQDGARSLAWGVDTGEQTYSSNSALVFDLRDSPTPVLSFGADLLDYEGGCGRSAFVGVFGRNGRLIKQEAYAFQDGKCGHATVREYGISSTEPIGAVVFFVGSASGNEGHRFRIAAADFWAATTGSHLTENTCN